MPIQEQTNQVEPVVTTSDWLTVLEAADILNIGKRSVFRAIKRKELRAARINERGDLRIARAWLIDWLERRAV